MMSWVWGASNPMNQGALSSHGGAGERCRLGGAVGLTPIWVEMGVGS